jgi:hypothetical protein
MRICYVDESGDTGTLYSASSPVQPVLAISGVIIDHHKLARLTSDFINLKQRFSPNLASRSGHRLNMVLNEMKGSDIRKGVASAQRRESRRAIGFLDKLMDMLEYNKVRIVGRVWVKQLAYAMDGQAVFTSSIQSICQSFQQFLEQVKDNGMVIADSRTQNQNIPVAHSIFTQKFKITGDPYPRIWEMPTFGHSNCHVGLQISDLVASALLFPIACHAYCSGYITSKIHVKPGHGILRDRYGQRLKRMQFRFINSEGNVRGGIAVSDGLGHRGGAHLFSDTTLPAIPISTASSLSVPAAVKSDTLVTPIDGGTTSWLPDVRQIPKQP